ncbi:hypothetical protein GGGNBK_11780 [Sporosarcina sp. ANT_H38]|nr:hypothetical protein [Sporosarcina sp. ANT_H38]
MGYFNIGKGSGGGSGTHEVSTIENGEVHGMRVLDGVFQFLYKGNW